MLDITSGKSIHDQIKKEQRHQEKNAKESNANIDLHLIGGAFTEGNIIDTHASW